MCKSALGISWLLYVSNGFEIVVAFKEFFDNDSKGQQTAPAAPPPVPGLGSTLRSGRSSNSLPKAWVAI